MTGERYYNDTIGEIYNLKVLQQQKWSFIMVIIIRNSLKSQYILRKTLIIYLYFIHN